MDLNLNWHSSEIKYIVGLAKSDFISNVIIKLDKIILFDSKFTIKTRYNIVEIYQFNALNFNLNTNVNF